MPSVSDNSLTSLRDLNAALDAGDLDAAEAIVQAFGRAVPAQALRPAADLHRLRGRWAEAAKLLGRIIDPDSVDRLARCLARNMAALQRYRPELYRQVMAAIPSPRFTIANTAAGLPTIACGGIVLSPGGDPLAGLERALASLQSAIAGGDAIGLQGLGDGYLLAALAARPPKLIMDRQQAVHVMIDDAAHLLAAMRIHDYSGEGPAAGAFAQQRVFFHVGPDWDQQLLERIRQDPTAALPATCVRQELADGTIAARFAAVRRQVEADWQAYRRETEAHAAELTAENLARVFAQSSRKPSPQPPRNSPSEGERAGAPRALLITSRFTTVLQHATRDSEDAFRQLGWETRLLIEPAPHHQITPLALARAMAEFKPDLIFTLDHLRREYNGVFPPRVPMICWIQDHLPNLTCREAGASIGLRDFVLTMVKPMYRPWGYPDRQMIDTPKLTRMPSRPVSWRSDGDDLVYVSNASQTIEQAVAQTMAMTSAGPGRDLIETACGMILETYERGGAIGTLWELGRIVDQAAEVARFRAADATMRSRVIHLVNLPLNNALYRQQALRWAAKAAAERGLTLSLYGNGWDTHPEFSRHARGVVKYGPELEELTRRSKINLQIIPSFCLHQRMLDGLAAGGFFLLRAHPADMLLPAIAAFLERHLPESPQVQTVEQARAALATSQLSAFDDLLRRAECLSEIGFPVDLVEWARACQRAELIMEDTALPHLDDISFHDEVGFARLLDQFLGDEPRRRAIADAQRRSIEHRLSYTAGLGRVIRQMQRLLAEEAEHEGGAIR